MGILNEDCDAIEAERNEFEAQNEELRNTYSLVREKYEVATDEKTRLEEVARKRQDELEKLSFTHQKVCMKYACVLQELERLFVAKYGDVDKIEKGEQATNNFIKSTTSLIKSTTSIRRSNRNITTTTTTEK